jgi:hypothetical protein
VKPVPMLISSIRRDGGTQIRAALDEATIARYVEALQARDKFPPVRVWFDGCDNWLSDGFHRVEAALRAGHKRIEAEVIKGERRAAIYDACGANATHGLPRSNADKRRSIETLLADADWSKRSDRMLAQHAGVSHTYVAEVRESIQLTQRPRGNVATAQSVKETSNGARGHEPTGQISREDAVRIGDGPPNPTNGTADAGMASGSGDEGAGDGCSVLHVQAPAPDEPRMPSIDLLGLDDVDPAWLALVSDVEAALGAFDNHLRQAQASVAPLVGMMGIGAHAQALRQATHDLAARARKSVLPMSACKYCKDPDDRLLRRENCSGCHGLGWLTADQLGDVPRELEGRGEAAKVIDQKAGGYVPRARKLRIEDAAGRELVVEREDDEELAF